MMIAVSEQPSEFPPDHPVARYRQRRQLPPTTSPAIEHPATHRALKLQFIAAVVLLAAAVACAVGAVWVVVHRRDREAELRRSGVSVVGHVISQDARCGRSSCTWYDDVQWSYHGAAQDDDTTLTASQQSDLPPVGSTVSVLVDPTDPSFYAINGEVVDLNRTATAVAVLIVPAGVALVLGALVALSWLGLRSVLRQRPWQTARVAEVHHSRRRYATVIDGPDPRLPATFSGYTTHFGYTGPEGMEVWVALGDRRFAVCHPGAFALRGHRYRG